MDINIYNEPEDSYLDDSTEIYAVSDNGYVFSFDSDKYSCPEVCTVFNTKTGEPIIYDESNIYNVLIQNISKEQAIKILELAEEFLKQWNKDFRKYIKK